MVLRGGVTHRDWMTKSRPKPQIRVVVDGQWSKIPIHTQYNWVFCHHHKCHSLLRQVFLYCLYYLFAVEPKKKKLIVKFGEKRWDFVRKYRFMRSNRLIDKKKANNIKIERVHCDHWWHWLFDVVLNFRTRKAINEEEKKEQKTNWYRNRNQKVTKTPRKLLNCVCECESSNNFIIHHFNSSVSSCRRK